MVAKIVIGKSIRGILHYNEQKVAKGEATLILSSGFAGDIEKMSFHNKVQRFNHLTVLKPSVKTNALHITLNFDASEKIDNTKMQQIAIVYMERIGFGEQPFLAYRHNDVAHQHVHIATTSIQRNGIPINLHNIGRTISEPVRKEIEREFNLVVAESRKYNPEPGIKPADPKQIHYGHIPTKRALSNVITAVTNSYKFTSLAELNAVLKQFNVTADRGQEDTEMYQKKGLIYSLLDMQGNKVGVPIKASAFYSKPTLRNLEKKFEKNEEKRKPFKNNLISRIDTILYKYENITKNTLIAELNKQGVSLIFRQNEQGYVFGTTFVDHQNKTVFNGSDLGKNYSAKGLTDQIRNTDKVKTYLKPLKSQSNYLKAKIQLSQRSYSEPVPATNYLRDILEKPQQDGAPTHPKKKKKRKRGLTI